MPLLRDEPLKRAPAEMVARSACCRHAPLMMSARLRHASCLRRCYASDMLLLASSNIATSPQQAADTPRRHAIAADDYATLPPRIVHAAAAIFRRPSPLRQLPSPPLMLRHAPPLPPPRRRQRHLFRHYAYAAFAFAAMPLLLPRSPSLQRALMPPPCFSSMPSAFRLPPC